MLSVIIPARNEIYLKKTIESVLSAAKGDIEVIVILDGYLPNPQINMNDMRVVFYPFPESIGQRAAINYGAKVAKGEYIMKIDAHCSVDEGFDIKLARDCEYECTMIPRMYNLDVETWKPKLHKLTDYMYIGSEKGRELRAEYYRGREYHRLHKNETLIDDTMCCMGPCFFMHKDRFLELGGLDEGHGGWGQMGVEVSLKAWLSGGALKVNKNTWFAHWFRGGSGPGFPYKLNGKDVDKARKYSRDLWLNDKWPLAKRPLQWLVDKFNPPSWNKSDLTILFYTANVISNSIMAPVVRSLRRHGYPIVSVSQKPMDLGTNIVVDKQRSLQNIYRQVLIAAKEATTEYVALCEDDCLYLAEHFTYRPKTTPFAYNLNRWLLHLDEKIYSYRRRPILSQCIAHRETLVKNLEERFQLPEIPDKYCGEPGVFDKKLGMAEYGYEVFETGEPNLVVCHSKNTSGRKYLGKDVEPCKSLPVWGAIDYWLRKFEGKRESHRQWSYIGSTILDVEDMYSRRMDYCDPRKKGSLKWFMQVFPPYLNEIIAGEQFTDEQLSQEPYFSYLVSKLNPVDREPELTSKGRSHVLRLMRDVINLYTDIKANGLRNPLDCWREGNRLVLNRGGRRLEILHALGYKTVPVRIFKNKEAFRLYNPDKRIVEDDSIHCLAMHQFMKLKEKATDKYWVHDYLRLYDQHIGHLRSLVKKILEIGVFRGVSLLLWKEAFPNAEIFGIDKDSKIWQPMLKGHKGIKVFVGLQEDTEFLNDKITPLGRFDIIIDDAGHKPLPQQASFEVLWDSLNSGGWYVIEDLYGNYRRGLREQSTVNVLKNKIDEMHMKSEIRSLHFYYNICFMEKR